MGSEPEERASPVGTLLVGDDVEVAVGGSDQAALRGLTPSVAWHSCRTS